MYGVLYGTTIAYPIMVRQGSGHIVNTASSTGLLPLPLDAPYCTSKYAIVGLSLSLRLEGADLGVKVSAVCPGYVRTNLYQAMTTVNLPRKQVHKQLEQALKVVDASQAAHDLAWRFTKSGHHCLSRIYPLILALISPLSSSDRSHIASSNEDATKLSA
jgi:short-subunit dehydrogenase